MIVMATEDVAGKKSTSLTLCSSCQMVFQKNFCLSAQFGSSLLASKLIFFLGKYWINYEWLNFLLASNPEAQSDTN